MVDIPELRARVSIVLGATACTILLTGLIGWAASAAITSAVVASGAVDIDSYSHPVQHSEGGVVSEVLVHEGQSVTAGDVLLRLDGSEQQTEYDFIVAQIVEAEARQVRLRAERDDVGFPLLLSSVMQDWARVEALGVHRRLFVARRETYERQRAQLVQRRLQFEAELAGLVGRRAELEVEAGILREQLDNQQSLRDRGLVLAARVSELARDSAHLAGTRATLEARDAELRRQISEIESQTAALRASRRQEAEEQFAETSRQLTELHARRVAVGARLAGLEVRAPATGLVHGLTITSAFAVLRPAEVIMQILSPPPEPILAVRVTPDEIDYIHIGQLAWLRFAGLTGRNLPDLTGRVTEISAATFVDERTGARYFRVEIVPSAETMALIGPDSLVPGMSVQAFITTGVRTPLAYLIDPVRDHFARALREP